MPNSSSSFDTDDDDSDDQDSVNSSFSSSRKKAVNKGRWTKEEVSVDGYNDRQKNKPSDLKQK